MNGSKIACGGLGERRIKRQTGGGEKNKQVERKRVGEKRRQKQRVQRVG